MNTADHKDFEARLDRYKDYFKSSCIVSQEMPKSDINFLCNGGFALMHAHFLIFLAEESYENGDIKKAYYLLGVIETIFSMHKLLPTDKMCY